VSTATRAAWFARLGFVLVLSVVLSGAARVASAAAGARDTCAEQRGASDLGCPPTCADGACARILPAILAVSAHPIAAARTEPWSRDEPGPPAPPPLDGVFHPPTR
jgi:hypothetical protein